MKVRFKKLKNGIKDTSTGLIWELEQNPKQMNYDTALDYAKSLGKGWRVPTIEELLAIIDFGKSLPATALPGMESSNYGSSTTTHGNGTADAWSVSFGYGSVSDYDKIFLNYVRCVR